MKKIPYLVITALFFSMGCTPAAVVQTPAQVQPLAEDTSISASARAVPEIYASLAFSNGGSRVEILVSPGESVKQGQVLARSDRRQLEIALIQAKAGLRQVQTALEQLENQPTLETVKAAQAALVSAEYNVDRAIDRGALRMEMEAVVAARESAQANLDAVNAGPSPQQLESARAAVDQAQATVDLASYALDQSQLIAPFEGQIIEIYLRDFETASPGAPVFLLADLSRFKLETTDLSEIDAAQIAQGMPVKISFDAIPAGDTTGTISRIALKSSPGSGVNYTLEITSDSFPTGLRWGMSAFIEIEINE